MSSSGGNPDSVRREAALTIVGTGGVMPRSGKGTTAEAVHRMDTADRVLPAAEADPRVVEDALREGRAVCLVTPGHPAVHGDAVLGLAAELRKAGYPVTVLPGISIEDAMFADVGIDPADTGSQSFDANDFVQSQRCWEPSSALFLWRAGTLLSGSGKNSRGRELVGILRTAYPAEHRALIYEPALEDGGEPGLRWTTVEEISGMQVGEESGLVIPPLDRGPHHEERARRLGIDPKDLS